MTTKIQDVPAPLVVPGNPNPWNSWPATTVFNNNFRDKLEQRKKLRDNVRRRLEHQH